MPEQLELIDFINREETNRFCPLFREFVISDALFVFLAAIIVMYMCVNACDFWLCTLLGLFSVINSVTLRVATTTGVGALATQ